MARPPKSISYHPNSSHLTIYRSPKAVSETRIRAKSVATGKAGGLTCAGPSKGPDCARGPKLSNYAGTPRPIAAS